MKIISIYAKNYRTLEDVKIPFGENYCAISGKNNAGKSCIIDLLSNIFNQNQRRPWLDEDDFDYQGDVTQWRKEDESATIDIEYLIQLHQDEDAALIVFLDKLADGETIEDLLHKLVVRAKVTDKAVEYVIAFDGRRIAGSLGQDVVQKLKTSNLMFLHNSTNQDHPIFASGRRVSLVEFILSDSERQEIRKVEASIQKKIKKFAKQHKESIQSLLGTMQEKYNVDFTTLDVGNSRHVPLSVRLQDSQVDAPLNAWGSGTQNKTHILLSLLWASRIKTQGDKEDKTTPIVVIEEPESFLHPTAQADFGRLLARLADDLGVQIIVTTHSPYMLNRGRPRSNILVRRPIKQGKMQGSEALVTSEEDWMLPFSEHLGIPNHEFESWQPFFSAGERTVILVEGKIDVGYFEHIKAAGLLKKPLPTDVQIVPYGGKDALKNTILLKFALEKFDIVIITFDLDAYEAVRKSIEAIGYEKDKSYFPIGLPKKGLKDIEGLLPERVRATVYGNSTELVAGAIGGDRQAKSDLKKKFLQEFKNGGSYTESEMKPFQTLVNKISRGIKAKAKTKVN